MIFKEIFTFQFINIHNSSEYLIWLYIALENSNKNDTRDYSQDGNGRDKMEDDKALESCKR